MLPEGASLDSSTGQFEWPVGYRDSGTYHLTFWASDGAATAEASTSIIIDETPVFPDVPFTGYGPEGRDPFWAYYQIEACWLAAIVQGYPDGTYQPEQPVSRAEMAVYISRTKGWVHIGEDMTTAPELFSDVPAGFWCGTAIQAYVQNNVVRGYEDNTYHPTETVTRDQMAVYVARAKGWVGIDDDMTTAPELFPDVPAGFWCGTAIQACVNNGVVQGYQDGKYHPEDTVTRDQMAVYIARAFQL